MGWELSVVVIMGGWLYVYRYSVHRYIGLRIVRYILLSTPFLEEEDQQIGVT